MDAVRAISFDRPPGEGASGGEVKIIGQNHQFPRREQPTASMREARFQLEWVTPLPTGVGVVDANRGVVDEKFRGLGIYKVLMLEALAWANAQNFTHVVACRRSPPSAAR